MRNRDLFKSKCAACIVLYNPDIKRLNANIKSVYQQVEMVYCFNNDSVNTKEIENITERYSNCELINNSTNEGIATAINYVCRIANRKGYSWLLTLDQDSVCPIDMIIEFQKYSELENVGIICPLYVDKRRHSSNSFVKEEYSTIDFCITSGSLMNIKAFFLVNGMDDYLFVGSVDDDYCYRLINNGYLIVRCNNVILDHELGEIAQKKNAKLYICLARLFRSSKLAALSYKRKISPVRVYYATRNIVYLSKKYEHHPYKFSKRFAIYNGVSCILRSDCKWKVLKQFVCGFVDGIKSGVKEIGG